MVGGYQLCNITVPLTLTPNVGVGASTRIIDAELNSVLLHADKPLHLNIYGESQPNSGFDFKVSLDIICTKLRLAEDGAELGAPIWGGSCTIFNENTNRWTTIYVSLTPFISDNEIVYVKITMVEE